MAPCNLGSHFEKDFTVDNEHLRFVDVKATHGEWAGTETTITWKFKLPGWVDKDFNGEYTFKYCQKLLKGANKKYLPKEDGHAISGSWPC